MKILSTVKYKIALAFITNQRQIQTTVQIKDGQTLLLGGLIDSSFSNAERSVPVISK
ncbi:hypothetical protein NGH15_26045, partial [Escherichia coli]|nr:hypothetical protein [Escherichia coli]